MAQEKLPPNEIMKNITDPAKGGERQDKNFRMFIEKTVNGLSELKGFIFVCRNSIRHENFLTSLLDFPLTLPSPPRGEG